ncbi:hypothetical protein D4764_07G0001680 [Takifugu flavidus]|uniref:Uncharacterized protein n=1 Tax=Takifugu flavidus TaxID=433684 RepID=A0A5C6MRM5_9TELE|nr:hypothetical protein D4764_07G0001680 [Takifugu flavidus]
MAMAIISPHEVFRVTSSIGTLDITDSDPTSGYWLQEKRIELSTFLREITTVPEKMRTHARLFYGVERCSLQSREELLEGLPQLSPEEKTSLDCKLTLEELTVAVN